MGITALCDTEQRENMSNPTVGFGEIMYATSIQWSSMPTLQVQPSRTWCEVWCLALVTWRNVSKVHLYCSSWEQIIPFNGRAVFNCMDVP